MGERSLPGEFAWYGRLGIWVGAIILVIQSVLGRGAGLTTAIGAIIISVGLIAFLIGLSGVISLPAVVSGQPAEEAERVEQPAAEPTEIAPPEPAAAVIQTAPSAPLESIHVPGKVATVATFEVSSSSGQEGPVCAACQRELQAGDIALRCPVCGRAHHAGCWINNRFHCAGQGCQGKGSLAAPGE